MGCPTLNKTKKNKKTKTKKKKLQQPNVKFFKFELKNVDISQVARSVNLAPRNPAVVAWFVRALASHSVDVTLWRTVDRWGLGPDVCS